MPKKLDIITKIEDECKRYIQINRQFPRVISVTRAQLMEYRIACHTQKKRATVFYRGKEVNVPVGLV